MFVAIPYDMRSDMELERKNTGKSVKQVVFDALKEYFAKRKLENTAQNEKSMNLEEMFAYIEKNPHSSNGEKWSRDEIYER